jgi:hypothetical protein
VGTLRFAHASIFLRSCPRKRASRPSDLQKNLGPRLRGDERNGILNSPTLRERKERIFGGPLQRTRGVHCTFQPERVLPAAPHNRCVKFPAPISSCTVSVVEGHTAGGVIQRKGPNGVMYKITGASTASPSCSIQSGNVFAE